MAKICGVSRRTYQTYEETETRNGTYKTLLQQLEELGYCDEEDRIQLERDLNREIKLIFDKNGINIPYPQIVVNEGRKSDTNKSENGKNE